MATFKIKCEKNKAQTVVTIRQQDEVDLSALSSFTVNVYTSNLSEADATYSMSGSEVTAFKTTGIVELQVADVLPSTDDDFYTLEVESGAYLSNKAGVAITLKAAGKVYTKQGFIDVYSPEFRVDRALMAAHMLYQEMNMIENLDASLQKRIDFTSRLATLKQILKYE